MGRLGCDGITLPQKRMNMRIEADLSHENDHEHSLMAHSQESFIIANFVAKLRTTNPLSCESLQQEAEFCESDADVALYERYFESDRCKKILKCALDAFSVIRDVSSGYADLHWNPGLKPGDIATFKVIYPILRSCLDCLLNQIKAEKGKNRYGAREARDKYTDSSTLTYEGLFLLIKTSLEFIHPLAYSCDGVVLSQLVNLLDKTGYSAQLVNANLSCLAVYLCRLYGFGYLLKLPDNQDLIRRQHWVLFHKVISIGLLGTGKAVDPNAVLFLKRVVGSILHILNKAVSSEPGSINQPLVVFMTKFVDVWYASLVKFVVNIRTSLIPAYLTTAPSTTSSNRDEDSSSSETESSDEDSDGEESDVASEKNASIKTPIVPPSDKAASQAQSERLTYSHRERDKDRSKDAAEDAKQPDALLKNDKDRLLLKLCNLIYETPKLPPSHRMRLITQITFVLMETTNSELELEALEAILALLDFSDETNSAILKSNLLPLMKVLTTVLMNRIEGEGLGLVSLVESVEVEKYVLLVYSLGQVLLNVVLFKYDPDPESVDHFLQDQIRQVDTSAHPKEEGMSDAEMEVAEEAENLDLDSVVFEMTSNVMRVFNQLLNLNDDTVDEAVTNVICWMLRETKFDHTFKLAAPVCALLLRTKKSRMLDVIYGKSGTHATTAQIALATSKRWLLGSKIFKTALEHVNGGPRKSFAPEPDEDGDSPAPVAPSTSAEVGGAPERDLYAETDTVLRSLFRTIFDSYLEVLVECNGRVEEEMQDCLGLYFACFGLADYLKKLPLEKLYMVPITSERYHTESFCFMLPVLKKQLSGFKMALFPAHILPVLNHLEYFVNKTSQLKFTAASTFEADGGSGALNGDRTENSDLNKLGAIHKQYEEVYNELLQLLLPLSSDEGGIDVLMADNYLVLKFIVNLLDRGADRFNTACKVISNLVRLDKVALELIGILVKKFINIEVNFEKTYENTVMCDSILAAIANVAKFCPSDMLSRNLESFERALNGKRNDSVTRLSKALFPCVSDDLKHRMYRNYLKQPKDRFIYLAVRIAMETVYEKLQNNPELLKHLNDSSLNSHYGSSAQNGVAAADGAATASASDTNANSDAKSEDTSERETASPDKELKEEVRSPVRTRRSREVTKEKMELDPAEGAEGASQESSVASRTRRGRAERMKVTEKKRGAKTAPEPEPVAESDELKFVRMVVCVDGMSELASYLDILSKNVDTTKQRISCLLCYTRLLLHLKTHLHNVDYSTLVSLVTKPLIFECIINSCSNNSTNRSHSLLIYTLLCELDGSYHNVLKVTLSTLYYNYAVNREGENINIGIMKLLCHLFATCYSQFDNVETMRLVVYLTSRLQDASYKFYVHLLKFFRVIMVNMNPDHLMQAAPHVMKIFHKEKFCTRAKVYVRRLVEKMLVRLKREYVFAIFPKDHFPLLNHIIATRRRRRNRAIGGSARGRRWRDQEPEEEQDEEDEAFEDEDDQPGVVLPRTKSTDKEHLLIRRRAAAAHKLKEKREAARDKGKDYKYIKLNRKASRKDQVKVLKNILKNKNK